MPIKPKLHSSGPYKGLDKHGSRPEALPYGDTTYVAQQYTAKEWDTTTNRPITKTALRDQAECDSKFRSNYEKTFGHT